MGVELVVEAGKIPYRFRPVRRKTTDMETLGRGMSAFDEPWTRGSSNLGGQAAQAALQDAGLALAGLRRPSAGPHRRDSSPQASCVGQVVLREVGVVVSPSTLRTPAPAARARFNRVVDGASGQLMWWPWGREDDRFRTGVLAHGRHHGRRTEGALGAPFQAFAMMAKQHMRQWHHTEQMALVAVKNHGHASLNPLAHFRNEITVEDVVNSALIAEPIHLYDCCPVSDGAAAAVLVSSRIARALSERPVKVAAAVIKSGTYADDLSLTSFRATTIAAKQAYEQAGIQPDDIDLAEVHDCFTIAEIIHYEDLGFCAKGEGGRLVQEGRTTLGGAIPVNVSGGLKAKGHPIGATGVAQVVEIVEQLRGRAGQRQVDGAKVGLTHTMGGFMHGDCSSVSVQILQR